MCSSDLTADAMQSDERPLCDLARHLTVDDFAREMSGWVEMVDADGADPDAHHRDRSFTLAQSFEGSWYGTLGLGSADGAFLEAAVQQLAEELYRQESADAVLDPSLERSPAQRRADALIELVRRGLAVDVRSAHPQRPALTLLIPVEDQVGGRSGSTASGGRVRSAGMDRLSCDAVVSPLGWTTDGVPLSHGRTRRLPSAAQRRALTARDRGCVFPGCTAPPGWCDGHHREHWKRDGGSTDLDNLALVCPYHHSLLHEGGWTLRRLGSGELRWVTPQGRELAAEPGWEQAALSA